MCAVTTETTGVEVTRVLTIKAGRALPALELRELWEYRELLYFLVWRDLKVRYKQTVLGTTWAILQPLATAAVFTIVFGRLAGIGSDGLPYPLFSYTGLVVWTFFAQGVTLSSVSLLGSASLITKVYFPRFLVPLSTIVASLVDLAVAFPMLIVMMAYYRVYPTVALITVPLLVLLAFAASAGVGLWLSALCVEYRDVRHVVPFLVQIWLFVTPVIYPASRLAPALRRLRLPFWIIGLNPMVGVVEGFRRVLLGTGTDVGGLVVASALMATALLVSGAVYFRSVERSFADVV